MTIDDIYPLLSSHEIILFDMTTNKVHTMNPESTIKTLQEFGDYKIVRLIPLDYQKLQITITNKTR